MSFTPHSSLDRVLTLDGPAADRAYRAVLDAIAAGSAPAGTLLTEGLWGLSRNPNYLGELCIYLGFTLLPMHWLPLSALAVVVVAVWIPNMRRKDKSLSRYPEFAAYKSKTKLIIPYLV